MRMGHNVLNGQSRMRTLSLECGSRASIYIHEEEVVD